MESRRSFVAKLAAGSLLLSVPVAGSVRRTGDPVAGVGPEPPAGSPGGEASQHPGETPKVTPPEPPWAVLSPLEAGAEVAAGWRVAELAGVADGSFVLTLENARGRRQRVHVCRHEGAPQGIVHTRKFDLVMMNGGDGETPTEESLARALVGVGQVIARNELDEAHRPVIEALMTHEERLTAFGAPTDGRLR